MRQINFVADFFRQKLNFTGKNSKTAFRATLRFIYVSLKARARLPISVIWTFLPSLAVYAVWADIGRNRNVRKGVGNFEGEFQGNGVDHQRLLASENYISWAITRRCLRDPKFSHFGTVPACGRRKDRQTDGHTRTANIRASVALRR